MPRRTADQSISLLESFATFGDLLKYLRRRVRLTQSELAIAVGYGREQITKLETNRRLPDLSVLTALFVPALELDDRPDLLERLLQLAFAAHASKTDYGDNAAALAMPSPSPRTNLRLQLTSFVGRGQELAELQRLLVDVRLLALTGTGGIGKTRLALQLGAAMQAQFADGVWLVELASLGDPELLAHAVALALGLAPAPGLAIDNVLLDYLRDKHLLLILDNCEHLLAACLSLVERVLQAAPQVCILTTSRESLGSLSAVTWQVPPLTLPALDLAPASVSLTERLAESEALRLFVERAASAKHGFALTPQNASAIAELCQRLDGLPLAIELAATRVAMLSVREIVARLGKRFKLLTSGNSTALARHQTLRALIDWSYDLLSSHERTLLMRLATFAGGWTLEAAEWMSECDDALDLLTQLVNKSLVVVDERDVVTRYRLLETIGEYAREKLAQANMEHEARARHLRYYLDLVEQAAPHLTGLYHHARNKRLEAEHDNLRAALEWAAQHDPQSALRLFVGLWYFWLWNGYWSEGLSWASKVLPAAAGRPSPELAWALIGRATLAGRNGEYEQASTWLAQGAAFAESLEETEGMAWARITQGIFVADYEQAALVLQESVVLARDTQNDWLAALALFVLGERARSHGDLERATLLYGESLSLFRSAGDLLMTAWPIGNLGRLALARGDYAEAQSAFSQSVALCRAADNKLGTADWLVQLATVALYQLDYQRAQLLLGECLRLCSEIGNVGSLANCLVIAAGIAQANANWARSASLLAAAETVLERFSRLYRELDSGSYAEYTRRVAAVRDQLDEPAFSAAWAMGRALSTAQALAYALPSAAW